MFQVVFLSNIGATSSLEMLCIVRVKLCITTYAILTLLTIDNRQYFESFR